MTSNLRPSAIPANRPEPNGTRKAAPVLGEDHAGQVERPSNLRTHYGEAPERTENMALPVRKPRVRTRDLVERYALELAPRHGLQSRRELTPEEWRAVKPFTIRIMDHLLRRVPHDLPPRPARWVPVPCETISKPRHS